MTSSTPDPRRTLTYILPYPGWTLSVSPFDSDRVPNLTIMQQVVATLVKYTNNGRFEPYLAKEWTASANERIWDFHLRADATFDDGTPITAPSYVRMLKELLRAYAKKSPPLVFTLIEGWDGFISNEPETSENRFGILALSEHHVQLRFKRKPFGLLEFLGMPYFGAYHPKDFSDGKWRDAGSIIASGAYRLLTRTNKEEAVLEKRTDAYHPASQSPDRVVVHYMEFNEAARFPAKHLMLVKRMDGTETVRPELTQVRGVPTILTSIILSPFRDSPFHEQKNRILFHRRLRDFQRRSPFDSKHSLLTEDFYPNLPFKKVSDPEAQDSHALKSSWKAKAPLKVMTHSGMPGKEQDYAKKLVSQTLERFSLPYEFVNEPPNVPIWQMNELYDIRIPRVNTGGSILSDAIRMMFCSRMGITFPDPSGRICGLTNDFESEDSKIDVTEYGQRFNQILQEDSVVLPLFHTGWTWFFGPGINLATVSASMAVPRFDLIQLE